MRRIYQCRIGKTKQFLVQAVVEQSGKLLRSSAFGDKSGRPTSPMNNVSPVRTPQGSDDFSSSVTTRQMLSGGMAGGLESANPHRSHPDFRAIAQRNMRKPGVGMGSDVDLRAGTGGEFLVAGNEVGVQVSFENVA